MDEDGAVGAGLALVEDAPALAMVDEGVVRALLTVHDDGPTLILYDEEDVGRALLGAGGTETPDSRTTTYPESSLRLFDPDGNIIWSAPR